MTNFINLFLFVLDEMPIRCYNCERVYKNKNSLKAHLGLDCGKQKQYKCYYCKFSSKRKSNLQFHMQRKHLK